MRLRSLKKEDTGADTDQQSDDEEQMLPAVFPPGLVALFFFAKLEHAVRTGSPGLVLFIPALLLVLMLILVLMLVAFALHFMATVPAMRLCNI